MRDANSGTGFSTSIPQHRDIAAINIASHNLRGLRSGLSMLNELCRDNFHIIAFQEHWLRPDEIDKLSIINNEYNFSACSGMTAAVSDGFVSGQPFGGVGGGRHKSLNRYMEFVKNDTEGHCSVFKLKFKSYIATV